MHWLSSLIGNSDHVVVSVPIDLPVTYPGLSLGTLVFVKRKSKSSWMSKRHCAGVKPQV